MKTKDKNSLDFRERIVYRSLGGAASKERIGAGFLDKTGKRKDFVNNCSNYYSIIYVIEGEGEYIDFHGNRFILEAGCFFQRFPDLPHSNYINPEKSWKECFIDFGKVFFNALSMAKIIKPEYVSGNIGLDMELARSVDELTQQLETAGEEALPSIVCSATELILSIFNRYKPHGKDRENYLMVEKASRLLGKDLHERINIRDFCAVHHWGYENFRKIFARQIGISPAHYRIRRRMDTACQMLMHTQDNISEIASKLGYLSPYEFSSQFKKFTGVSPKNFRAKKA